MFSGRLVDGFKIKKIKFHAMKKWKQNLAPSMTDALLLLMLVYFLLNLNNNRPNSASLLLI